MRRARTRSRILGPILAAGWTVAAFAPATTAEVSPPGPGIPGLGIPAHQWSVLVTPGIHGPPYRLKVSIDPTFPWPRIPGREAEVRYRVTLIRPDGERVEGVGWLDERFRSTKVPVLVPPELLVTGASDQARQLPRTEPEELEAPVGAGLRAIASRAATPAGFWERLARIDPVEVEELPSALWEHRILLEPFAGGEPLRQEVGPEAPEAPRYTWGAPVADAADPCHGKTPEACVRERLEAIRDRLCNTLDERGAPRFFFECIVFSLKLSSEPPRVEIHCNLDGAAASVEATEDQLHKLKVNGDYFLTRDCLEGIILHELTHVFDIAGGRMQEQLALQRALERLERARKRLEELPEPPSPEELAAAEQELVEAAAAALPLWERRRFALIERLRSECSALFAVLENIDFLGPWEDALPWVVADLRGMIHQQISTRWNYDGIHNDPEVVAVVCDCLRRIRTWIDGQPDVQRRFAEDRYRQGMTWREYLDYHLDDPLGICQGG